MSSGFYPVGTFVVLSKSGKAYLSNFWNRDQLLDQYSGIHVVEEFGLLTIVNRKDRDSAHYLLAHSMYFDEFDPFE